MTAFLRNAFLAAVAVSSLTGSALADQTTPSCTKYDNIWVTAATTRPAATPTATMEIMAALAAVAVLTALPAQSNRAMPAGHPPAGIAFIHIEQTPASVKLALGVTVPLMASGPAPSGSRR